MEHLFYKPKGFTIKHAPLGMLKQKEPPSPHRQRGLFLCRLKLSQSYILDISSLEGKENILEAWESMLGRSIITEAVLFGRDIAIEVEGLIPIEVLEKTDTIGALGEVNEDRLSERVDLCHSRLVGTLGIALRGTVDSDE